MKNQFEQHIKQSLESFEADYNSADWTDMQNRLSKAKIGKSTSIGKGLMIAASVAVIGGLIYYFSIANTNKEITSADVISKQQHVTVASKKPAEVVGNNTSQSPDLPQKQGSINNSGHKKTVPGSNSKENNSEAPEKNSQLATNTAVENKITVQDQPKEPVVVDTPPVQPSVVPFRASFHANVNRVCVGATVRFSADNNEVPCIYKWNFGDGESSSEQNPSHSFAEEGTYNVKLHVVSVKDKKQADQKNTIIVAAAPLVQVNYSASEDNNLLINFEADADKVTEWKWSFGDKQTSSVQNPSHAYSKKGNYKVELTAKNGEGCSSVIVKDVNLKNDLNLLAPNGFTPSGDDHNTWLPAALLQGEYIFTLTIFDKTGRAVFKTTSKNNPWDGKGAIVGDTFRWIAIVKDKNGDETTCQGLITISE